jgi:hypothetical protein
MLRIVTYIDNLSLYQFAREHQERNEISSERHGCELSEELGICNAGETAGELKRVTSTNLRRCWSRGRELNSRPADYETAPCLSKQTT